MSRSALLQRVSALPQPSTPILVCSKILLSALPIAEISIGAVHLHNCPQEPNIPIYLIVLGVFSLAPTLLSWLPCTRRAENEPTSTLSRVSTACNSLTILFLFCWFIAGNVWIYSIYEPNYSKNSTSVEPYCNKTLYQFAFWSTTVAYILSGLFLLGGCCALVCCYLCGRADPDDL